MASVYGVEEFRSTRKLPKTMLLSLRLPVELLEMVEEVGLLAPLAKKLLPAASREKSSLSSFVRGLLS